jgi:hypothetical protein
MMCKRQGKSPLKLDPSCFNLELFFVRAHMYVRTQKYVGFLTCVRVRIHAYQHASRGLSNYITPNNLVACPIKSSSQASLGECRHMSVFHQ